MCQGSTDTDKDTDTEKVGDRYIVTDRATDTITDTAGSQLLSKTFDIFLCLTTNLLFSLELKLKKISRSEARRP